MKESIARKPKTPVGIVSYGTYVPHYRLKTTDIAHVWRKDPADIIASLGIDEKSVPAYDEDAVTIAIEAAGDALSAFSGERSSLRALFVGSESHPYAVNPTSTIVGELLGLGNDYLAADMQFACKAGTAGMQAVLGLVSSGHCPYGMAIGADAAQSKTHDALEYTSAAAGAAFIIGRENVAAGITDYTSYSSDTPDFWRRDGIRYPSHAGRFTGEPAFFAHVMGAARQLLKDTGMEPGDFSWCVFHMPNGKFPREAAKRLGFTPEQLKPSLTVDAIGNPYSASSLLGLAAVLDIARPAQKILMVSYGSGAGSDAFVLETTDVLAHVQEIRRVGGSMIPDAFARKTYISYDQYLKQTHKI